MIHLTMAYQDNLIISLKFLPECPEFFSNPSDQHVYSLGFKHSPATNTPEDIT